MEEIDLKELFRIFWEKKSTIILLIAIFMVVGFIYSSFIVVPNYKSSTKLILAQSTTSANGSTSGITTTDITLNSKLVSTYSTIVKSDGVIRKVISNLDIDDSEQSIRQNVSVSAEEDTEIIRITVTNTEPEKAAKIANEMAKVFMARVKELYNLENVQTLDPAEPNEIPANINHTKTIIIFGAIGLILAAGYIFILFMLDNSIKSGDDVEKCAHVPVLASIPVYEPEAQAAAARSARNKKKTRGGKRK